jgi:single-strand DNA-binding protein
MVFIEGKLRTRSWEKDGVKKYATEIIAENMTMLSKRENENNHNHDSDHGMIEPPHTDQGSPEPF